MNVRAVGRACLTVPWLAVVTTVVLAQRYTPPAPVVAGSFPSTCAEPARADLQGGVSLLFLLAPGEALRAFDRAADADPDCAIAEWGRALAVLRLPEPDASSAQQGRARLALARAGAAQHVSARERAYIDAAVRLVEPAASPYSTRLSAFAAASAAAAADDREDAHAALVAALAALAASALPGDAAYRSAVRLIQPVAASPVATGAATLLVLALDNPSDAAAARQPAEAVLAARPPSPGALRLAGRIFHRLGDWASAQRADEAALEIAGGIDSPDVIEVPHWEQHPLPWLMVADVERGQADRAARRITEARDRFEAVAASQEPLAAWRLRAYIDLSWLRLWFATPDWQGERPWPDPAWGPLEQIASALPAGAAPTSADVALGLEVHAQRALAQGLVAARAAWPRGEPDRLQPARTAAAALERLARDHPVPPRFELMRVHVLLALAAALEARDEFALLEAQATALEARVTEAGDELTLPMATSALVGELRLQLRDAAEARAAFEAAGRARPGRWATARGLARAQQALARRP